MAPGFASPGFASPGFASPGFAALWRGLAKPSRYAVLVAGALPVLAFPRLNLEFLGWCGLVPGLLLIRRSPSAREAAVRGWWFGAGFLLAALYWLVPDIGPALLLIAVVFGALWTGFGVAAWGLLRPPVSVPRALAAIIVVPSYWLLTEWARSWQGFGGPWAVLGTSQWQHPAILGLAAVGGVWLVSLALVGANTGILGALVASAAGRGGGGGLCARAFGRRQHRHPGRVGRQPGRDPRAGRSGGRGRGGGWAGRVRAYRSGAAGPLGF